MFAFECRIYEFNSIISDSQGNLDNIQIIFFINIQNILALRNTSQYCGTKGKGYFKERNQTDEVVHPCNPRTLEE